MGRPKFEPTDEQRRMAEGLTGFGMREDEIARLIGIDPKTLRKHFRRELDVGAIRTKAAVAKKAFEMAMSGQHPAMTKFFLERRAGWGQMPTATQELAHEQPAKPSDADLNKTITDQLARIAAAASLAGIPGRPDTGTETAAAVPVERLERPA